MSKEAEQIPMFEMDQFDIQKGEWEGMPEYNNVQEKEPSITATFKFRNEEDFLKVKNFSLLRRWRLKQEKKLWLKSKNKKNLKIMNRSEVKNFMDTYQRITQQMFKDMPKYSSIIMNLNSSHQIKNIRYRYK